VRLHRRQWVLGPAPLAAHDDWLTRELRPGLHLSWDPDLEVVFEGRRALLGIAVQTEARRPSPAEELAGEPDPDPWAGRFVLVDDGRVVPDAGATMSVFIRRLGDHVWASSTSALLRTLEPRLPPPSVRLVPGGGMDWFPLPGSGVPGIERLMPSQVLHLPDGVIEHRPLLPPIVPGEPDAVLERLEQRLLRAVRALAERGPLALGLTAGKDSRLVVAAGHAAGVDAFAYTYAWRGMRRADRELPPRLARSIGMEHRLIEPGPRDPARLALWDAQTDHHSVEHDREFFARGQLDALADAACDIGGSLFDVPVAAWYQEFPQTEPPPTPEETAALIIEEMPSAVPDGIAAWARCMFDHPEPAMDWRDRFALEQRVAGWIGSINTGLDLAATPALHIANCRAYLADTTALPLDRRFDGRHQIEMVGHLAPALAAEPVNPPGPVADRLQARARRELVELRQQRWPHRYLRHRVRRWRRRRTGP
jgi:hypothetical protein